MTLNELAREILRKCEIHKVQLVPQFVSVSTNVVADVLSQTNQVLGAYWTLCMDVFLDLSRKWPVMVDLFATNLNNRLSIYISLR